MGWFSPGKPYAAWRARNPGGLSDETVNEIRRKILGIKERCPKPGEGRKEEKGQKEEEIVPEPGDKRKET